MSTVAEIKAAIDQLSPEERCKWEAWPNPFAEDDRDRQMKRDAGPGGRLYRLMEVSEHNTADGKLIDLPACPKP